MKIINKLLIASILVLNVGLLNAQVSKEVRMAAEKPFRENPAYRIGEELPDFGELKVINSSQRTVRLSDFKDRLLILDFWTTGCKSCIEAMPHMQALQRQFHESVKILPVTYYSPASLVADFWEKNKYLKNLTLPSVVEADAVWMHFEHSGVPHEVWIYKGKVIGITNETYIDEYNISQVLAGKIPDWPVKNDFYQIDGQKHPLFKFDPKQVDTATAFVKYAQISDYKKVNGVSVWSMANCGIVRDAKRKTVRAYLINQGIYKSYFLNWLYSGGDKARLVAPYTQFSPNTVVWEVADRSKYIYERRPGIYEGDWVRKNGICFESLNPDTGQTDEQVYTAMNKDLDRLLGLHVRWEKRREKVLVLVRTGKENKFLKRENVPAERATAVYSIVGTMNQQADNPYIFDETNYNGDGVLNLGITDWTDIAAIQKAIAPYGLALKEEERLVDKFVFSEMAPGP